jgi:hypothetical protein
MQRDVEMEVESEVRYSFETFKCVVHFISTLHWLGSKSPTQSTDSLRHCLCAINSLYELSHAENNSKLTNRNRSLIGVLKDTLPTKSQASPVSARKQFINSIMVTNSFHFNGRLRFQQLFSPSQRLPSIERLRRWHLFNLIIFPQFSASAIIVIRQLDCLAINVCWRCFQTLWFLCTIPVALPWIVMSSLKSHQSEKELHSAKA